MTVSVVVVSSRPTDRLRRCLDSVLHQAHEVLVVDNDTPKAAAAAVARELGARWVRAAGDAGVAAAANRGVAATQGDVVALLGENAVASDGWLAVASGLLEDPSIGAVSPRLVLAGRYLEVALGDEPPCADADSRTLGRRLTTATLGGVDVLSALVGAGVHPLETGPAGPWRWTAGRLPFYAPLVDTHDDLELILNGEVVRPTRVVDLLSSAGSYLRADGYVGGIGSEGPDDGRLDVAEERFALSSSALVTRRDVWARVGGFAKRYRSLYEDTDWCWRGRLMGLRMFYDPAATVRLEAVALGGYAARRDRHLAERNRLLTLLRNAPIDLALAEALRKRRAGGDDGVAELLPKALPRALGERQLLRRGWAVRPREIFERWAGVDAPVV
ncbi:MAG: glycosyltransferase family 2 protein [Acidimicrobiales bacterium]